MQFERDEQYASDIDKRYGEYLTTYTSDTKKIRAYFFRRKGEVVAYVTFAPGLYVEDVTEPYYSDLRDYAEKQGFLDQFRLIYVDSR